MPYSSVWISVPGATACVMIGWMVACRTLGSMCRITCPPRWIRPALAVSPSPACRVPARPEACDAVLSAPFFDLNWLTLVPGHDVNLIDLYGVVQLRDGGACHQTLAELLSHRLHIRSVQAQFLRDLPVGEVQPHQVEAQNPYAQRLVMSRRHRAGEIIKTSITGLAQVTLPVPLAFVMAVADDRGIVAARTAHAI